MKFFAQKGQSIIELLVTMALMAILIPAIIGAFMSSDESQADSIKQRFALESLKKTKEAVLIIRDKGFENIEEDGVFYIKEENYSFALSKDSVSDAYGITTTVQIEPVYRNSQQTIVSENGIIDPLTKKITLTAYWNQVFQNNLKTTFFLTRHAPNASFIQSLKTEFEEGVLKDVVITDQAGGEIKLENNILSGYYESEVVDLGFSSAINTISPKIFTPLSTKITYQISLVDAISNSCLDAPSFFVGPDGTENTYYTGTQMVRFEDDGEGYENPGRCFKYKVFLTSEIIGSSPVFEEFIVNFSQ